MDKSINILNKGTGDLNSHFYSDLETELGNGNRCFNCTKCGDIVTESGNIKNAIIDCLGSQAGINNVKISESCNEHTLIDNYSELRKGD